MKIALIDSGVNIYFNDFNKKNIESVDLIKIDNKENIEDDSGHGTSCLGEIFRISPDADVLVIKVFDHNTETSLKKLIEALEFCLRLDDIRIINLSCTCFIDDRKIIKEFKDLTNEIFIQNKLIICSSPNLYNKGNKTRLSYNNRLGYPGCFENVISVKHEYSSNEYFVYNKEENEIIYYDTFRLMPYKNNRYRFFRGNSSCAPKVSVRLYNMLEKVNISNHDIFSYIEYCNPINESLKQKINIHEHLDILNIVEKAIEIVFKEDGMEELLKHSIEEYFKFISESQCERILKEIEKISSESVDYKLFTVEDFMSLDKIVNRCLEQKLI